MSYSFSHTLVEPDDQTVDLMLAWAKTNCPSYTTIDGVIKGDTLVYTFYFSEEKDLVIFTLRWG